MSYLVVFLGAGIGGAMRHGIGVLALRFGWTAFPFATLTVNVIGSLMMGLAIEYFALKANLPQNWKLFLTTGILGGFTTFSAFSMDAVLLYERGKAHLAFAYIIGSVSLSIIALFAAITFLRAALKA